MNEQHANNPKGDETPKNDTAPRIHIEKRTPTRLGWQSARVTISSPDFPSPITVTMHWRESSTCYIGFRRFSCGSKPEINDEETKRLPD